MVFREEGPEFTIANGPRECQSVFRGAIHRLRRLLNTYADTESFCVICGWFWFECANLLNSAKMPRPLQRNKPGHRFGFTVMKLVLLLVLAVFAFAVPTR